MANSIINDLFSGKIEVSEDKVLADYYPLINEIAKEKEYFKVKLDKEDGKRLESMDEMYHEISSMMCYQSFKDGLKFGVILMSEILVEHE